jgi:hypothetical protein
MRLRPATPAWGRLPAIAIALMCALVLPAAAQPKGKKAGAGKPEPTAGVAKEDGGAKPEKADAGAKPDGKAPAKKDAKPAVKNFDFTDFNLNGKMRTPQLLYFLERANEELERASLEKRSFIPHMVRSVEEEAL